MYRIAILLLTLLCSLFSKGQEKSLEECIKYAINNNLSLSTQKIQSEIMDEAYKQSKRNLMPTIETGISGTQIFGRSIDPKTNSYIEKGSILSSNMYLTSNLIIFQGFIKQNTIRYKKLQRIMSLEDVNQSQMQITFDVMNSYYDVVYYLNLEKIADEQIKLTELNVQNTKKRIKIGLKAEADLLEIQAQKASEIHNKITVENKMQNALLKLKKLMNYPIDKPLKVMISPVMELPKGIPTVDSIYNIALEHMPMVRKAELEVLASRKNLAINRGRLYPTLSIGGDISSSYADSWKVLRDANNKDLGYKTVDFDKQITDNISKRVFARLSIPIFQGWANRSDIKIAKQRIRIAKNKKEIAQHNLLQEITEDRQQLTALTKEQQQLQIKELAVKKAFQVAEKKLEQGIISTIEFYTAKNQLANTQVELLRTRLQRQIKEQTMEIYLNKQR